MHTKGKGYLFFHNAKNQHNLRVATFITFLLLVVEKLLSGATAIVNSGQISFTFTVKISDVICILVYFTVAILLAANVKYKYLLIPDFFLLGVKLYVGTVNIYKLIVLHGVSTPYEKISALSKASECLLFSLFLILLFIGKLIHTRRVYSKNYPFVCMRLLIACFPITVGFEIAKAWLQTHINADTFVVFFELTKNILNEAFLDLPYFLLLLLLAFVPESRH